jgi:hypothetical protein
LVYLVLDNTSICSTAIASAALFRRKRMPGNRAGERSRRQMADGDPDASVHGMRAGLSAVVT